MVFPTENMKKKYIATLCAVAAIGVTAWNIWPHHVAESKTGTPVTPVISHVEMKVLSRHKKAEKPAIDAVDAALKRHGLTKYKMASFTVNK